MPNDIIGRKEASAALHRAKSSRGSELVAVIGRRRIGKTYLINQTFGPEIDFSLTGLQHGDLSDQIQNLLIAMGRYFPSYEMVKTPVSWLEAFNELTKAIEQSRSDKKLILFFDELPWMATKRSKFLTAFGWFWNSWAEINNVVVIICGSAASWMIDKVFNDRGGLHNRVTHRIFLYPFTLKETREFLLIKKIRLDEYQITQLYMAMGGIPMYLEQIKPGKTAVENIKEICFKKQGYLWNEYPRLFASLFDNHENYEEVIEVLATKKKGMTRTAIIAGTKFKNGGMLTKILKDLDQSGFIDIYGNYKKKKRDQIYRLSDCYCLFYIKFIKPLLTTSHIEFSSLADLPQWRIWSGYAFENICLSHIKQIREAMSIAGIFSYTSTFFAKPKDSLPGAQIDLVIDRSDQAIHICEIKFSVDVYNLTKKDTENITSKKSVFRYHTKSKKQLFTTMITTFGLRDNDARLNHVDQEVTMKDLFAS